MQRRRASDRPAGDLDLSSFNLDVSQRFLIFLI
jgi:hypothetical protein